MNRKDTKKAIKVMQASLDGATVLNKSGHEIAITPVWNWSNDISSYKIKPKPIERWMNVYKNGDTGAAWDTKAKALSNIDTTRIVRTAHLVEVEE